MRGLGTAALILAAIATVGMLADFVFALPLWIRWTVWVAWMGAFGAALYACILRPVLYRASWSDLAAVAERQQPQLRECLTNAVGLLEAQTHAHGSPALIAALTDETVTRTRDVDLTRSIPAEPAARRLALGLSVLAILWLPSLLLPDPFAVAGKRFFMPWADIERAARFVIAVQPGDAVVGRGDALAISAELRSRFGATPLLDAAWLEWKDSAGVTQRVPMVVDQSAPGKMSQTWRVTLPRVDESLRYRVVTASVNSRRHGVTVVDPPALSALQVRVEPPIYTKLPAVSVRNPSQFEAWEDSRVTLTLETNKPIRAAEVDWPVAGKDEQLSSAKPVPHYVLAEPAAKGAASRWTASVTAERSGPYTIRLTDEHRLNNRTEPVRRVNIRIDAAPSVALSGSDEPVASSPDDILLLNVAARDDIAVATAEVHYAIARGGSDAPSENGSLKIQLPGLGTRFVKGEAGVDLKPLKLKPGDGVSYRVKVMDNRPLPRGPNAAWSSVRGLKIVDKAEPLSARRSTAERAQLQEMLTALKKSAAENRQATEQLRYAADAVQRGNGRWDAERQQSLTNREKTAQEVVDRLHLFAKELDEHPQFEALARPARQIANVEAEGGRELLDQARRSTDPSQRLDDLKQADASLTAVQTRLEEFQRRFDEMGRLEDDRRRLRGLAERQENLATRASELSVNPADRARLDQVQAEQNKLNRELEEMMQRSPELRADVLTAQAKEAAALAEHARDLARRQRDQARDASNLSPHDAILRDLAEAQRALEDDARRLALRVDSPLAENGRARLNAEALAQAVEPLRRGQIEQSTQALDGAENELRRLARDLEDVRNDPKALARRLAQRQDALRNQTAEVIRDTIQDRNAPTPVEKNALVGRVQPLAERQKAIARLAAAIPAPRDQRDALKNASERTIQALDALRDAKPNEVETRQNEARDALNHLANVLPDANQRREQARPIIGEARGRTENIVREVERHLHETGPQPGRPYDPQQAAADLAERLAPLAQQQGEVAADLAAIEVEPRTEPQRERAARRAQVLADALARARRDSLPALAADARASAERLEQKFYGRQPADDLAADLAAEMRDLAEAINDPAARTENARRLASAIRGLNAPDARLAHAAAMQAANDAARAVADPNAKPQDAIQRAADTTRALAQRLADADSLRDQVAMLARTQRALDQANGLEDRASAARAQRGIAEDFARVNAPDAEPARRSVNRALELADRAANPNLHDGQPTPTAEAQNLARQEAAQRLEQLAAKLSPTRETSHANSNVNSRARASELAREQRELANQIQAVQDRLEQTPDKNAARARVADELAPLAASQAALAGATRNISDPALDRDPRRNIERRRAAAETSQGRAAGAMTRRDPNRAAAFAREAAAGLEQLAQAIPENAPEPDPSRAPTPEDSELALRPAHANEARALAQRERQIRERLQAILGDRVPPQQSLRNEATALGRELANLRDQSRETSPRGQGPAHAAADLMQNHAPPAMDQGAEALGRGRPDVAREAQRRAAEAVERAAQQADDLAAALRADRPLQAPDAQADGTLAGVRDAQRQASQELAQARDPAVGRQAAQSAAGAMHQAAQGLRTAAQAPRSRSSDALAQRGEPETPNGNPSQTTKDPKNQRAGTAEADLSELKELVRAKTGRAWGELPGHLRTEILQMSQGRYREDYARLIQLYFKEIAASERDTSKTANP
jgi:hypothetical protein